MNYKLPLDFYNRMKEYLGDEFDAFIASYDTPEIKGIRLNAIASGNILDAICNISPRVHLEGNSPALSHQGNTGRHFFLSLKSVPWEENGYWYVSEGEDMVMPQADNSDNTKDVSKEAEVSILRPGKHPYHEAGAYYIQEPSAMAPVNYLDINPGDRVLDLCASPGGKSTQIASKMMGEGILISNEINTDRARILSENIERMGVRNALVISEDPRNISGKFEGFFDKILVDAPCSGEGMFRRSETAVNEWSLENVKMCAERQSWILDEASKMLSPGGTLVYSTCTFAKEEDEEQIKSFLSRHEDFELVPMYIYEGMRLGFDNVGIRIWPHVANGEGHYLCALRKCKGGQTPISDEVCGESSECKGGQTPISDEMCGESIECKGGQTPILDVKGDRPLYQSRQLPPPCGYEPDISSKAKSELKEMYDFLKTVITDVDRLFDGRRITKFRDQIYLLPKDCPMLSGIKVLRPGLHLGTMLKGRFEPAHSLAVALTTDEVIKKCHLSVKNMDDLRAYKYINGETFDFTPYTESVEIDRFGKKNKKTEKYNGQKSKIGDWYVIFVDDFSIGWGKYSNGMMKNHYPKGIRKKIY